MKDRRNIKRWSLLLFLPVYDQKTDEVLGHVADITADGLMVFSKKAITLDKIFKLVIKCVDLRESLLFNPGDDETDVIFTAESRWTDTNPDLYRTGLMFTNLDDNTSIALRRIVRNVAHNLY